MKLGIWSAVLLLFLFPLAQGEKTAWRQATDAELASLLPTRAPVEKEHIETEMRTASGIVNSRGPLYCGRGVDHGGLLGGWKVFALPCGAGADSCGRSCAEARRICVWLHARGRLVECAFQRGGNRGVSRHYGCAFAHRDARHHELAYLAAGEGADSDWAVWDAV